MTAFDHVIPMMLADDQHSGRVDGASLARNEQRTVRSRSERRLAGVGTGKSLKGFAAGRNLSCEAVATPLIRNGKGRKILGSRTMSVFRKNRKRTTRRRLGVERVEERRLFAADFGREALSADLHETHSMSLRTPVVESAPIAVMDVSGGINEPPVNEGMQSGGVNEFTSNDNSGWITLNGSIVEVHGTNEDDTVVAQYIGAPLYPGAPMSQFVMTTLSNSEGVQVEVFAFNQVSKFEVHLHDGDDSFINLTLVPSLVEAGEGNDSLSGGGGTDDFRGRDGHDVLAGGGGHDLLYGGDGNDNIHGGSGNDVVAGIAGYDTLYGDAGDDTVSGGLHNDLIYGGDGDDFVSGDGGNDTIYAGVGIDEAWGGVGNDLIHGGSGGDIIRGGSGNDVLRGESGNDDIRGDSGNDTLFGSTGADTLRGGNDSDTIYGGSSGDSIYGDDGYDLLFGDSGNDTIRGGDQDDYVRGGTGNDTVYGQHGDDDLYGDSGNDTIWGYTGHDRIFGGDGNDSLDGYTGNDLIRGGDDDDYIEGDGGNDELHGDSGDDEIHGGDNNDEISGGSGHDLAYGGSGHDELSGGSGFDELYGGTGNDIVRGDSGEDVIYGSQGNDMLFGGGGDDEMYGGDGHDNMYGGANDDIMEGNAGVDGLYGGTGANQLDGGSGSDRFLVWLNSPQSNVYDGFNEDQDTQVFFANGSQVEIDFAGFEGEYVYAAGTWTESDVIRVDTALSALHRKTQNKTLLERPNGDNITFTMHGDNIQSPDGSNASFLGVNMNSSIGIFENGDFSDGWMWQIIFHEIAHNWDNENPDWQGWQDLSGWTTSQPSAGQIGNYTKAADADTDWWYLSGSDFARDYGRTNPAEDFATAFALYFMDEMGEEFNGQGAVEADDIPTKIAFLDAFFASIS